MDAIGFESVLIVATRTLAWTAFVLYVMRSRKNRVLRGYPVIGATAATLALCAAGWTLAAVDAFDDRALRAAIAATVPLAQVLLLLTALRWFAARVGRDPAPLPSSQFVRDETVDTLMHVFVLFVLTIGALILIVGLQSTIELKP